MARGTEMTLSRWVRFRNRYTLTFLPKSRRLLQRFRDHWKGYRDVIVPYPTSVTRALVLVHIEVYTLRYSLYAIRFALLHRRDSTTSTLHHLNVVCGGEQIVLRIANTV